MSEQLPVGNPRGATALFCDDIRTEENGKSIFIGVYHDSIIVDELPTLMPQLAIWIVAFAQAGDPFRRLTFKLMLDEEILQQDTAEISERAINAAPILNPQASGPPDELRITVRRILRFSPFVIEREGMLRLRIATEKDELRAGGVRIELAKKPVQQKLTPATVPVR